MLDGLLNLGCLLDWITPALAFLQDLLSGPISDFGIPANPSWGRREIRHFLEANGVHVWGLMYNFRGDVLLFTVERSQAGLTWDLLTWAGIPILYAPAELAAQCAGNAAEC